MSAKTTTTAATTAEQITKSIEVTVRVTGGSGTLFDAAEQSLATIDEVESVTLTDSVSIEPRNGKTNLTVIADITVTESAAATGVVETLEDEVFIENAKILMEA